MFNESCVLFCYNKSAIIDFILAIKYEMLYFNIPLLYITNGLDSYERLMRGVASVNKLLYRRQQTITD